MDSSISIGKWSTEEACELIEVYRKMFIMAPFMCGLKIEFKKGMH
jgi:hypothetical protein